MSYSTMRIGGLASGMDIDQIVSDLMKAERMKVDKLYQQKQVMEWQKQEYRAINLKLKSLNDASFDMKLSSSYLKYKAVGKMSDGKDFDKYFSVAPGAGAVPGNYKVKVEQVADYARLGSVKTISKPLIGTNELTGSIEISEENNKFEVTLDGVTKAIELEAGTYTAEDLKDTIQSKIDASFGQGKIVVDLNSDKLTFQPADNFNKVPIVLKGVEDADGEINDSLLSSLGFKNGAAYLPINPHTSLRAQLNETIDGPISFKINGHEFNFSSSASLQTIMDKINTTSEAGVRAHYDSLTDKFVLTSRETGQAAKIEIEDESNFFKAIGFDMNESGGKYTTVEFGQNARIVLNDTIVEKASNDFTAYGMRFNLNEVMETDQEANFRVENDPDAAVESIKKYVELYNETITLINNKLLEERYRKFPPLTDAQKKDMSENDIKLWEEKAKSGLLKSDPLLDRIVNGLRSAVSTPVAGLPKGINSLSSIGITTSEWKEFGKLHIDEKKLRAAISKDPDAVMRIFNSSGDQSSSQGVANRVYDILKGGVSDLTEKAGGGEFQKYDDSNLGKQIWEIEKCIDDWENKLWKKEEYYWQRFTQMEKAIQAANQQSMWLASQMGMYSQG